MNSYSVQTNQNQPINNSKVEFLKEYVEDLRDYLIQLLDEAMGMKVGDSTESLVTREQWKTLLAVSTLVAAYLNSQESDLLRTWTLIGQKIAESNDPTVAAQLHIARKEYRDRHLPDLPPSRLRFMVERFLNLKQFEIDDLLMLTNIVEAQEAGFAQDVQDHLTERSITLDDVGHLINAMIVQEPTKYERYGKFWQQWVI